MKSKHLFGNIKTSITESQSSVLNKYLLYTTASFPPAVKRDTFKLWLLLTQLKASYFVIHSKPWDFDIFFQCSLHLRSYYAKQERYSISGTKRNSKYKPEISGNWGFQSVLPPPASPLSRRSIRAFHSCPAIIFYSEISFYRIILLSFLSS